MSAEKRRERKVKKRTMEPVCVNGDKGDRMEYL